MGCMYTPKQVDLQHILIKFPFFKIEFAILLVIGSIFCQELVDKLNVDIYVR